VKVTARGHAYNVIETISIHIGEVKSSWNAVDVAKHVPDLVEVALSIGGVLPELERRD
jgi:hypothetical protein